MIKKLHDVKNSIPSCVSPLWAGTGHLQTILGHLLPSNILSEKGIYYHVPLDKDSELIHTTYFKGTTDTVVYLFHGLGGSAEASYMQRAAIEARFLGHHVFLNNHRGCGLGSSLASETYHSGRAEDLSKIIEFGRNLLPGHRHIAVGFSLSGNALLLLAAKFRAIIQPDFAIAVNAPINLDSSSIKLQQGLNRIYDKRFVSDLEGYLENISPEKIGDYSLVKNLRDFDERYTAPMGGFLNRNDYYSTCSAKQFLGQINIPTVIITSEDDPFVDINEYKSTTYSKNVVLHIEKHGGHMGYLLKSGLGYKRWLDIALREYFKAMD